MIVSPSATCALCGERIDAATLLIHLRVEHDMDVEPETWPDGEFVIVDRTLEPDDFTTPEADKPEAAK